jgi:F5/8 type C domain.
MFYKKPNGSVPATPHKYWRIFYAAVSFSPSLAELQFHATSGGPSLCIGGVAAASNIYSPSFPASNAFDGNAATYWATSGTGNFWLSYALISPSAVEEIFVQSRPDFGGQWPQNLDIQYSDDNISWTTLWSIPTQTAWPNGEGRTFSRPSTDPYYGSVISLLHFDKQYVQTAWTVSGTANISTAQSKFGGSSGHFDGISGYISAPASSFDTLNGPFCVEAFVNPTAAIAGAWFSFKFLAGGKVPYCMGFSSTGNTAGGSGLVPFFGFYDGAWRTVGGTVPIPIGEFTHLAGSVDVNKVFRLFVNGTMVASATITNPIPPTASDMPAYLGRRWDNSGTPYFSGYIDEFRVTIGDARYTTNFTPALAAFDDTDASWANVVSLLHFNGADSETTFTDSSEPIFSPVVVKDEVQKNVWSINGGAKVSAESTRFGDAGLSLDGVSGYVSAAADILNVSNGPYTIEMFIKPSSGMAGAVVSSQYVGGALPVVLGLSGDGIASNVVGLRPFFGMFAGSSWRLISSPTSLVAGNYYHIAGTVDDTKTYRLFVNGNMVASGAIPTSIPAATTSTYLGRRWDSSGSSQYFKGSIDEFRMTKGVARYTSNFTPPPVPFGGPDTSITGITSRYWRLYVTAKESTDGYINCGLIGLNAVVGDLTNQCPGTGGTASESSSYNASLTSINAWNNSSEDGTYNTSSFWHSASQSSPWWSTFDCGEGKSLTVRELALLGVNVPTRMPKDFQLQTSTDGVSWTTVLTKTGVIGWDTSVKFFPLV